MKKTYRFLFVFAFLTGAGIIGSLFFQHANTFSSGSPGGRTGAPSHNNSTCTGCHGGSAQNKVELISSDIPEEGYVPGDVYEVIASIAETGKSTFGFELKAEDEQSSNSGDWIIANPNETKKTNFNSVTHTSAGTSGEDGKNWVLEWRAPQAGSGDVTFYGAFNAANGNGSSSGDKIYVSQLKVKENKPVSVENASGPYTAEIKLFPNPVRHNLKVDATLSRHGSWGVYIIDQGGLVQAYYEMPETKNDRRLIDINVARLSPGTYSAHIVKGKERIVRSFVKV